MPRKSTRRTRKAPKKTALAQEAGKVKANIKAAEKTAESRVKEFIESGKPAFNRAKALVNKTGRNLSKQTRALRHDLAQRVSELGTRVEKERKSLGRKVEHGVKTTLASLNIPTRSEINLLARRVEELSRKIDGMKRR
jgi:polyhydroxyalkanoate synthesis regulator phasin